MMMTYLRANLGKARRELNDTSEWHARFSFFIDLYEHHPVATVDVKGDYARAAYHKVCALR